MNPDEWKRQTIGALLDSCTYGVSRSLSIDPKGIPVLRMGNIQNSRIDLSSLKYADLSDLDQEKVTLSKDDILFNRTNSADLVGKVALIEHERSLSYASYLLRLRANRKLALPRWLYYVMAAPAMQQQLKSIATIGVSQCNINPTRMRELEVDVPPLAEQKRIAAILTSVDDAIQATRHVIQQTRRVKQGLLQQLLTKGIGHKKFKQTGIGTIPDSWEVVRLRDVGEWKSGGTPSKSNPNYWNGDIPWASAKDMKVERLEDTIDHVTKLGAENGTCVIPSGTLLMVVRGMILAHTFPVALTLREMSFNQDLKALLPSRDFVPDFILYWLQHRSQHVLDLADESTHGTKRLPSSTLFDLMVPCPPRGEQRKMVERIVSVEEVRLTNEQKLVQLGNAKRGLMQDLLTGKKQTA